MADELYIEYKEISDFSNVPIKVREYFRDLDCKVPQIPKDKLDIVGRDNLPFYVNLSQSDQKNWDWGVLCSRGGVSSIVIYWHDKAKCPSEFATKRDDRSWEGIGEGILVFSRYATSKPGKIIEEPYLSKGIYSEYTCVEGKWIKQSLGGH